MASLIIIGMDILITGSDGMIGSALCQWFLSKGHHVIGIDNQKRYGDIIRPHHRHPRLENYVYDIKDIKDILCDPLDLVIHCAYDIGGIKYWTKNHNDFYNRNHLISCAMIDWIKQNGSKHIIWLSSSQVYENDTQFPSYEHLSTLPSSGYAREKLDAENLCLNSSFSDRCCILRPFNCIGTEELIDSVNHCHVAVDLAQKIVSSQGKQPIELFGSGKQVRSFTVLRDFVEAVDKAINISGVYNVCGSHTMTIRQLAETMWSLVYDSPPMIVSDNNILDNDVVYRKGNDDKFRNITQWNEHHSIDQTLLEIIASVD